MHSGLDRMGRAGALALLLLPPICFAAIRMGARTYCEHAARNDAQQRQILANLPEMERALVHARMALQPLRATPTGEPGRAEELGRWMLDVAKTQKIGLNGLNINPGQSDPLTPAMQADFRCEEDLHGIIRLLQNLQSDSRIVIFESVRMRQANHHDRMRYLMEARLRAHTVTLLN